MVAVNNFESSHVCPCLLQNAKDKDGQNETHCRDKSSNSAVGSQTARISGDICPSPKGHLRLQLRNADFFYC